MGLMGVGEESLERGILGHSLYDGGNKKNGRKSLSGERVGSAIQERGVR